MCGICGYYARQSHPESVIRDMTKVISHRGPDSEGFFRHKRFTMGMRRLSIIDLETGDQPIHSVDSSLSVVFNGEIYNYRELRLDLQKKGVKFRTHGDTEVILAGYQTYGDRIFDRLNGMFGIAIFDSRNQQLTLARDRFGIKPLYYYHSSRAFVFASEIKSILEFPDYVKALDYDSLNSLLRYKYIVGTGSMFQHIEKLEPGAVMKVDADLNICLDEKFWRLEDHIDAPLVEGIADSADLIKTELYNAVRRNLESDVPVGVFLSGGIDSAILTSVASEISDHQVATYSIGFEAQSYNELAHARLTAQFNDTSHHEMLVGPHDLLALLDALVGFMDEPLGDYGIIPNYFVSKFAANDVKVALSGAGADEIFGGYERYWLDKGAGIFARMPLAAVNLLSQAARILPHSNDKKSLRRRLVKYLKNAHRPLGERYDRSFFLLDDSERSALLTPEAAKHIHPAEEDTVQEVFDRFPDSSFLTKAAYADLKTILPNNYLIKEDRMSMASSLEVRVPFLDHELVEASFRVRDEFKIKRFTTKFILKEIFKDRIHREILNRPKQGFEAPVRIWLREELRGDVSELFADSALVQRGILDRDCLERLKNEHFMGFDDHSKLLFTLIGLELWYRQHFLT